MSGLKAALKDWGLALAIVIAVLGVWSFLNTHPVLEDGPAPEVVLDAPQGRLSLSEHHGEVVVLNFWATWCGPCIQEMPHLQAFYESHPDVVLYGVSMDEGLPRPRVEATARRHGATFPVVMDADGQVSRAFRVSTIPTTYVIDAQGQIAATRVGTVTESWLEAKVEQARQR